MSQTAAKATTTPVIEVSQKDLPLHCPTPDTELWSAHPKVFIPIEESSGQRAKCPYCGAEYQLVD